MAQEIVRWRLIALLLLAFLKALSRGFNLETQESHILSYPYRDTQGRESYFGFAVSLHSQPRDNFAWLVVGAPRANSTYFKADRITEPGVIFKCSLEGNGSCVELPIDPTGNALAVNQPNNFQYHDRKNNGWLGGAVDSQPASSSDRQVTGVCSPRWKNQLYPSMYLMNGACYWLNSSLPNVPAHKRLPLVNKDKQTYSISGRALFFYSHGEAGLSIHFPDDPTEMIIGAPGVFNWQGTVIRMKDEEYLINGDISRRRRQATTSEYEMFTRVLVPNPYFTPQIYDFDLLGYAVTSGKFFSEDEICYASGAPRGANSLGKVIIFTFPEWDYEPLNVLKEWNGKQVGEYFGAALVAADINGDGLSDLVVGSPMYSLPNMPDTGRIQIYLSSKDNGLQKSSTELYGSRSSYARFSTTLGSPGDLNSDGFHDVVVGAPWEGNGAVYVYMGSASGLRQVHSQRITPKDFPQDLKGFGMAFSRGVDIDNNAYPDLAIGSFMSGHVVVVKSRPVGYLSGYITATPSTIALKDTALRLEVCLEYTGHKVPRHTSIKGNITLDYGFPSARAHFTDTNTYFQVFKETVTIEEIKCTYHEVTVKEDKVDARQPLLLRMEYELSETPGVTAIRQPMTDPHMESIHTSRVSIVTGCELDGDETCEIDMRLDTKFLQYESGKKLVIGDDNKPVLEVIIYNTGEPVFLPNMTVTVVPPLALFLPLSHNCEYASGVNRSSLVCQLANPIAKDGKDKVEVIVDASQLTDHSSNLIVDVRVSGEGEEILPTDNAYNQGLLLAAQAKLKLHGYSKEEQVLYQRLEEDKINTTIMPRFIHSFTVVKNGPTPLEQVELIVNIPFNLTDDQNFVKIYAPKTDFLGQPFQCNLVYGSYSVDTTGNGDEGSAVNDNTTGIFQSTTNPDQPESTADGSESISDVRMEKVQHFNCSSSNIKCAQIYCLINSWPRGTSSAEFSVTLDVDLAVLAGHISAKAGAILKSRATASIHSLNAELAFIGEKDSKVEVETQIQPDSLPGKGIPWWVILLAVLGGLLLLGLLAYGLNKAGFFKRKEHEEMKAHQAHVESSGNYGSTNAGLVGD